VGTPVYFTNKTDRYDITEILLKVALNTITPPTPNLCLMLNKVFVSLEARTLGVRESNYSEQINEEDL
jgi:hypothetical protein